MDPSSKETFIALTLWEPLLQMFTLEWKPCATGKLSFQIKNKTRDDYFLFKSILRVIQMTNVKVSVERNNNNRKMLTATSRTVVTMDPNTKDGRQLSTFAAGLDGTELSDLFFLQQQSDQFIRWASIS